MAIVKCKECGKDVSNTAKKCPHCGISNPGITASGYLGGCFLLIAIIGGLYWFMFGGDGEDAPKKSSAEIAAENAACKRDLQCWGEKHSSYASFYCDDYIEKLAKYSHEWTDGLLEPKFSHFRWKTKSLGFVTYIGDKIKFQNGFGAWQNYVYECDFDPESKTVIDVRASVGRL